MCRAVQFGLVLVVSLAIFGCSKNLEPEQMPASASINKTYVSQVALHYEKGRHITTNYSVGIFLPVNTKVQLLEMTRKGFRVKVLGTGEEIEFINHTKHTHDTVGQSFEKLFGEQEVSMLKFNATERRNIESGTVSVGMSKAAVIVARGYPPAIETPTLQRDQWKYWKNRWDTILVTFKNDRVSEIKD